MMIIDRGGNKRFTDFCIVIAGLIFLCFNSISAQEIAKKKIRLYETWVTLNTMPFSLRGILFEIGDSSISVSNSLFRPDYATNNIRISKIYYNNIDLLKVRRINSIKKGAFIGGATGLTIGATGGAISAPDMGIVTVLISSIMGLTCGAIGTGIGALIGSPRDRLPINGRFDNFNLYRNRMQKYSYLKEYTNGTGKNEPLYEHKCYFGILAGPSFPLGDLADKSPGNKNAGFAKTGSCGNIINLGYRITEKFGISVFGYNNQYDVDKAGSDEWWGITGLMIGPMFSTPVGNKFYFDLKPRIGFADTQLLAGTTGLKYGIGPGITLHASFLYNFSRRWCAITEAGYFSTRQKLDGTNVTNMQAINLNFGIAYRFR